MSPVIEASPDSIPSTPVHLAGGYSSGVLGATALRGAFVQVFVGTVPGYFSHFQVGGGSYFAPASSGAAKSTSRRERELLWLRTHRADLQPFIGEWVVLEGENIVAHNPDPITAVREARSKGIKSPFVHRVESGRTKGESRLGL
jgi:hypothetical protein